LSAILGNQNAGQQEEQKFFIFMKENAIIRIDVKVRLEVFGTTIALIGPCYQIWRYNFSGSGIMANTENVFCCEYHARPH
jgi:hypothetical protein